MKAVLLNMLHIFVKPLVNRLPNNYAAVIPIPHAGEESLFLFGIREREILRCAQNDKQTALLDTAPQTRADTPAIMRTRGPARHPLSSAVRSTALRC